MLGSTNQSSGTLIVLKPTSKNKDGESVKPYFEISKKGPSGWEVEDNQNVSQVTGTLFKVAAIEEEWKGDKYFRIKLFLRDGNESYLIPFRLNIATRSLLNSLFSLESFENVSISYYQSKAGYDVYFVSQDDERVSWKYELSELPKPDEVSFKGKVIKDYTKLDQFYVEKTLELEAKIAKALGSTDKKAVAETEADSEVEF